ncbi:MAG: AAA family ATPase [Lentisphaeria bacterium]|nr:AAA family ATPase [Lentisphaeria bacterium]
MQKQLHDMLKGIDPKNSLILPIKGLPAPQKGPSSEEIHLEEKEDALASIHEFSYTPRQVKNYLDRFVIKQSEAKKVLSVAVCDHYNHIKLSLESEENDFSDHIKQNVLLLGPTGVGKTYLIKKLASLIGVPFVKADATKFSATGYMGQDVEDLVRDLVKLSDGNTTLAEYGIIYIDEIDKIATRSSNGMKDVSGRGVQINLLKLMEDSNVNLTSQADMMSQMEGMMDMANGAQKRKKTISTKNILFIVSGAFDQLSDLIKKREVDFQIGFNQKKANESQDNYLAKATTEDYIKYGFEPEFIGRLPIRVACQSLLPDDLVKIMTQSEGSILKQYINDFKGYDIDFKMNEESITAIAELAYKQKTGARGLMTVMEQFLREFKFTLPGTSIKTLEATKEMVENPHITLEAVLKNLPELTVDETELHLAAYALNFSRENNFKLKFNATAVKAIHAIHLEDGKQIDEICQILFVDYPQKLKQLNAIQKIKQFTITGKVVKNPNRVIEAQIEKSKTNDSELS